MPEATVVLLRTFTAVCLGALVGLERQVAQEESGGAKDFPGVRTFSFTALLGALSVLMGSEIGPWMGVAVFLAMTAFLVMRYRYDASERQDPGYTTEIASLCTFLVGALAQAEHLLIATVIAIAMVVLLRSKRVLHRAGEWLSPADMEVLLRFLVITFIVLPLLPDEPIDRIFGVLRPRDVWRMVVLISGVSFAGYFMMRLRAGHSGHVVMGMLGGLVSSTAAALAYARASRGAASARHYEALIVLAAATSFLRILVVIGVAGPALLPHVAPSLLLMSATGLLLGFFRHRPTGEGGGTHRFDNPLTMKLAFGFAAVYAGVLMAVAGARQYLGDAALYGTSALAGLIGADAPSLSLTRLAMDGHVPIETAARGVVIVATATMIGKIGILVFVADGPFARRVGVTVAAIAIVGVAAARYLC